MSSNNQEWSDAAATADDFARVLALTLFDQNEPLTYIFSLNGFTPSDLKILKERATSRKWVPGTPVLISHVKDRVRARPPPKNPVNSDDEHPVEEFVDSDLEYDLFCLGDDNDDNTTIEIHEDDACAEVETHITEDCSKVETHVSEHCSEDETHLSQDDSDDEDFIAHDENETPSTPASGAVALIPQGLALRICEQDANEEEEGSLCWVVRSCKRPPLGTFEFNANLTNRLPRSHLTNKQLQPRPNPQHKLRPKPQPKPQPYMLPQAPVVPRKRNFVEHFR